MGKQALIHFPIMEVYERRTESEKKYISDNAKRLVTMFKECGYDVIALTENELATVIFKDNSELISWYSGVGRSDYMFLQKYSESTNKDVQYRTIPYRPIDVSIINNSERRHKLPNRDLFSDEKQYLINRINTVVRRSSTTGSDYLIKVNGIIYCSFKDNNFFRLPKFEVGNGKVIIESDLKSKITTYSFGGVYMKEEAVLEVMRHL